MSGKGWIPAGTGACRSRKLQFDTRRAARRAARRMHDSALNVYRCPECGWFHIGHLPQRVRNGEVDKAAWIAAARPKRSKRARRQEAR